MKSWDEIYQIMESRRNTNSPIIDQMIEVRDRYNADWVLPNLSAEVMAQMPNLSPQIIADTVDNYGMRAGSVLPAVRCPAIKPEKQVGPQSRQYANIRQGILGATYKASRMQLILRKAYRQLAGYSTTSLVVLPDFRNEIVRVSLRDPLNSYPDPIAADDFRDPEDIGFIFAKSAEWITAYYPEAAEIVSRHHHGNETLWNMVEWIDRDSIVIGLMGPQEYPWNGRTNYDRVDWSKELRRWPNPTGMVTAACPARVTLDRIASQLANIIGITDLMAKLTALDVMAKEKSIFPDKYIVGKIGSTPQIVGGEWKDGRSGEINIILDAEGVGSMNFASDPMATQAIDRLERNARVSAGLVPQMGGETYGALRTGRGIDALMGAAVDPRLQEMQVVMETWLSYINETILCSYKTYWPNKTFVMPSGWAVARKEVEFTPSKHIETYANEVSYPIAGADVQQTVITLGQLYGMRMISKETMMDRLPFIADAATEKARIDEEAMEELMLNSFAAALQSGQASPMLLAFVEEERRKDPDNDIIVAVQKANRRMQELQAQQAPPPQPGQVTAPEAQPGMAPELAQQPPPQDTGGVSTPPDLANLRTLLNALGQTSGVVTR